jgi:ATP/ADP translocase
MNIVSLAKAIGIVLGSITTFISLLVLMVMYKSFAAIVAITIIALIVIALLWCWIIIIYENIEYEKRGYWDN